MSKSDMKKFFATIYLSIAVVAIATAQIDRTSALSGNQKAATAAGTKNITTRAFPSTTTFTPSPALQKAFNWWLAVKPTEFGVSYDKLPDRQSFYDSAVYKFSLQTTLNFTGLPFSPGLPRLQPDSL